MFWVEVLALKPEPKNWGSQSPLNDMFDSVLNQKVVYKKRV
jgi:hypothetical protein